MCAYERLYTILKELAELKPSLVVQLLIAIYTSGRIYLTKWKSSIDQVVQHM